MVADVSSWVTRLAKEVTDVILSARNLKELLDKATHLLDDVGAAFARIPAKASQAASRVGGDIAATAQRRAEQLQDLASHLGPQHALAGAPGMTMAQARRTGKAGRAGRATPTVRKSPSTTSKTRPSRPNHNEGKWGVRRDEAGAGAKGAEGSADAARSTASQWDDPRKVREWYDELPTKTRSPSTEAYQYQHRVLGTDVERRLVLDDGTEIWADSVTVDGSGVTVAWDAKHTEGGDKALYEGKRPEFLMEKFDIEMSRYRKAIESSSNPVSRLTLVTNTPEAVEFLGGRDILGPDVELDVQLIP